MSIARAAVDQGRWEAVDEPIDGLIIGADVAITTITVDPSRTALLRSSLASAVGREVETATTIADICPDPLVFALGAGLRRPVILDIAIDGGSEWIDHAAVPTGELVAVSRIATIEQRTTTSGRRALRVIYETTIYTPKGALVGIARGTSLHVEARR